MENIFTGKTVEEAVKIGLETLGLQEEDVEVEVLEEGKKRLIGSKPAQVKLTVREKRTDGERAVAFLEGLLPLIGTEAAVELKAEDEKIVIGDLTNISEKVKAAGITKTALTIVGDFLGDEYELSKLYDKTFTTEFRQGQPEAENER